MKTTTNKTTNEKRLETMRANLTKLESAANEILSKDYDDITSADKKTLLSLVNIAYHESGKIETIASIDGTSACEFCTKMRAAANENNLIICGGCYAFADKWKEAAWRRHTLNARILSNVIFSKDELATLVIPSNLLRINEDGDVTNTTHAINILRIIETHKAQATGFWFKNTSAVSAALNFEMVYDNETKRERYGNARFVQSSVLIGFPARPMWYTDVIFTVYPDKTTTESAIKNGAWECNGRKCKECGFNCYNAEKNNETPQHVAEVLRCNAQKRAEILAAYNAKKGGE